MKKLHLYLLLTLMTQVGQEVKAMEAAPEEEISEEKSDQEQEGSLQEEGEQEQEESLQEEGEEEQEESWQEESEREGDVYFGADEPMKDVSKHQKNLKKVDQIVKDIQEACQVIRKKDKAHQEEDAASQEDSKDNQEESKVHKAYLVGNIFHSVPKALLEPVLEKLVAWISSDAALASEINKQFEKGDFFWLECLNILSNWALHNGQGGDKKVLFLKKRTMSLMKKYIAMHLCKEDSGDASEEQHQAHLGKLTFGDINRKYFKRAAEKVLKDLPHNMWEEWNTMERINELADIFEDWCVPIDLNQIFNQEEKEIIIEKVSQAILKKCSQIDERPGVDQDWSRIDNGLYSDWVGEIAELVLRNMGKEQWCHWKNAKQTSDFIRQISNDFFLFSNVDVNGKTTKKDEFIESEIMKKNKVINENLPKVLLEYYITGPIDYPDGSLVLPEEWSKDAICRVNALLDQDVYNRRDHLEKIKENLSDAFVKNFDNIGLFDEWKKKWPFSQEFLKEVVKRFLSKLAKKRSTKGLNIDMFLGKGGIDLVEIVKTCLQERCYQKFLAWEKASPFDRRVGNWDTPYPITGEILGGAIAKMTQEDWAGNGRQNPKILLNRWEKSSDERRKREKESAIEGREEKWAKAIGVKPWKKIVEKL